MNGHVRVLMIGDSHVGALISAHRRMRRLGGSLPANIAFEFSYLGNGFHFSHSFFELHEATIRFTHPEFAANLGRDLRLDAIARQEGVVFGLSMGLHTARVFRDPQWTRHVPWDLSANLPGQPVSSDVLNAIIDQDSQYIVAFYRAMQSLEIPFFVVAAPPPYRLHNCMSLYGIAPEIIVQVDRAYRTRISGILRQAGIDCIHPPREVIGEDGFIKAEFRAGIPEDDPHHANADYGQIMMQQAFPVVESLSCQMAAAGQ
ncbi:hypothetical protein [Limobrevibacterium gyesilva]|uniref:Uncharacterized protein n=1 Tax=Limobrevibacterium gyesilva TaxID=2991712 RepID=A0AA42CG88_9PROT|nr:hypothetical protein [Limobrevibacterium gyesilva]MCW3477439.1 hypothetical protein [Limobrevibacterium gyesilva]